MMMPLKTKIPPGTISGLASVGTITFPRPTAISGAARPTVDQTIFDFWGTPSRYQAAILGKSASLLDTAQTRDNVFLDGGPGLFQDPPGQEAGSVAKQDVLI